MQLVHSPAAEAEEGLVALELVGRHLAAGHLAVRHHAARHGGARQERHHNCEHLLVGGVAPGGRVGASLPGVRLVTWMDNTGWGCYSRVSDWLHCWGCHSRVSDWLHWIGGLAPLANLFFATTGRVFWFSLPLPGGVRLVTWTTRTAVINWMCFDARQERGEEWRCLALPPKLREDAVAGEDLLHETRGETSHRGSSDEELGEGGEARDALGGVEAGFTRDEVGDAAGAADAAAAVGARHEGGTATGGSASAGGGGGGVGMLAEAAGGEGGCGERGRHRCCRCSGWSRRRKA
jgi:hypothetical protein